MKKIMYFIGLILILTFISLSIEYLLYGLSSKNSPLFWLGFFLMTCLVSLAIRYLKKYDFPYMVILSPISVLAAFFLGLYLLKLLLPILSYASHVI